MLLLLIKRSLI